MVARIYIIFTTGRHFMPIILPRALPRVGTLCQLFYPERKRGVKYRNKVPTRGKNNINSVYHELFRF